MKPAPIRREIRGDGGWQHSLLVIGESPESADLYRGHPFSGMVGGKLKSLLKRAGLNPFTGDVRINTVLPSFYGKLNEHTRTSLLRKHYNYLTTDLMRTNAKAILAMGELPLRRLTGKHNIVDNCGSITVLTKDNPLGVPAGVPIIATFSPSVIGQGKIQAEWVSFERHLQRAVNHAMGTGTLMHPAVNPRLICDDLAALDSDLLAATEVVVDTEYYPATHNPFLVGIATNSRADGWNTVHSLKPSRQLRELLSKHFVRPGLTKIAHNFTADRHALKAMGVVDSDEWFCTMLAFNALYPDLRIGLGHVGMFYLDGLYNWKDSKGDARLYNARDVAVTGNIYTHEMYEIAGTPIAKCLRDEIFPTAPLLYEMEQIGIALDRPAQRKLKAKNKREIEKLLNDCKLRVEDLFAKRSAPVRNEIAAAKQDIKDRTQVVECVTHCTHKGHEDYIGLRGKKFKDSADCQCAAIYERNTEAREYIKNAKAIVTKGIAKIKKWSERGFVPSNDHDVKWLLYDKEALGVTKVFNHQTKSLTANADAFQRILSFKKTKVRPDYDFLVSLFADLKRIKHLQKMTMFIYPPVDGHHIAHPPYRIWGAGTGRVASGEDKALGDKGGSPYAFNALNVPHRYRQVYIPIQDVRAAHDRQAETFDCVPGDAEFPDISELVREMGASVGTGEEE